MNYLGFLNSCRICLCNGASVPIFDNIAGKQLNIHSKLATIFGDKIDDMPEYPRNICTNCNQKVEKVISFINKYKKSQQIMQQALILKQSVKEEIYDYTVFFENDCYNYCEVEENIIEVPINNYGEIERNIIEVPIKSEPIIFENADQFKELIKKCTKQEIQDKVEKKYNGNIEKVAKKKKKINKKKNCIAKIKNNNVIAEAILEERFTFSGGKWRHLERSKASFQRSYDYTQSNISTKENSHCPERVIPPIKIGREKTKTKLCEKCGQKFVNITEHILNVHGNCDDKQVTCSICNKQLSSQRTLKLHNQSYHLEKKLACPICNEKFGAKRVLRNHHKAVHLKERRVKPFLCKLCGKVFTNAVALLAHERSFHTGERPFACSVCDKRFTMKTYLQDHMRLHTGETPHKCPACGKGFAQRCNMKSHIKYNHRISQLDEIMLKTIHPRYLRLMKP